MKFAVLLAVFAVCSTFAEPQFNPLRMGLNFGRAGMKTGENAARGGLNLAGNIMDSIFGHGHHGKHRGGNHGHGHGHGKHGHHGGGGVEIGGGAKGNAGADAGINSRAYKQISVIMTLLEHIGAVFAGGNLTEALTTIQQFRQALQNLKGMVSGRFGDIFALIFQDVNKLKAAANSKSAVDYNSIVVDIEKLVMKINFGIGESG